MPIIDLEQPRREGMPIHPAHRPGHNYYLYRRHHDTYDPERTGERTSASGMLVCMEHSGTHIDALCHQAEGLHMHGGVPVDATTCTPQGFTRHGAEEIPPIMTTGLLLDIAGDQGIDALPPGYAVTAADLQACCARHGLRVEPGSVVLVRTGYGRFWSDNERYLDSAGVAADASQWLAEQGVVAVGADNMAWDVVGLYNQELRCYLPGHLLLLVRAGVYIVENLQLEELAGLRQYQFQFVCSSLKLQGATGCPVRPLAIV